MDKALEASDIIFNTALQVMNQHGLDPSSIPLVMGYATQRLEAFALGGMAHRIGELEQQAAQAAQQATETKEG